MAPSRKIPFRARFFRGERFGQTFERVRCSQEAVRAVFPDSRRGRIAVHFPLAAGLDWSFLWMLSPAENRHEHSLRRRSAGRLWQLCRKGCDNTVGSGISTSRPTFMALNPQAQAMVRLLDARGNQPVAESTLDASPPRQLAVARVPGGAWTGCSRVRDISIPGPTAELHVRVYTRKVQSAHSRASCSFTVVVGLLGNIHLADRPHRSLTNATGCVLVAVD